MDLLDLPTEIFQRIVHELVLAVGVFKAWRLRRTCRTFAGEIYHNILHKQQLETFTSIRNWHDAKMFLSKSQPEFKRNFLLDHIKSPRGVTEICLNRFKDMVGFLDQETGKTTELQRAEHLEKLAFVLASGEGRDIMFILDDKTRYDGIHAHLRSWTDQFIAAIAVDSPVLVRKLLPRLQVPLLGERRVLWSLHDETHVELASKFGSPDTIKEIIAYMETIPKRQRNIPYESLIILRSATSTAIERNDCALVAKIIELHMMVVLPTTPSYEEWILAMANTQCDDNIQRIIVHVKLKSPRKISMAVFECLCKKRQTKLSKRLIRAGTVDLNKSTSEDHKCRTYALELAIRSGSEKITRALLDAGANIEGPGDEYGSMNPPLHVAIEAGRRYMVEGLLRRGARIHTCVHSKGRVGPSLGVALSMNRETIYEMIRTALMERTGRNLIPSFAEAKRSPGI